MPADDRYTTITTANPHQGPRGEPFTVHATGRLGTTDESYWSEREALDARDRLLDAGHDQVRILGLPTTAVLAF
jgi:hypothetical protein